MHAKHILRAARARGNLVDVEIAGVRRKDRSGFADFVELAEDVLLHAHFLIDRFDNQVAIGKIVEAQRRLEQPHRAFGLRGCNPAFRCACFIILAHDARAFVERFGFHFDDGDGNARRQEVHRNPATHRARTDHADALDVARFHVVADAVDLGGLTLGKEDVALRRRLRAHHQLHEFGAFERNPFVEGKAGCGFDAGNVRGGCIETTEFLCICFGIGCDAGNIAFHRHGARWAWSLGNAFLRKRQRIGNQRILACQFVDQADLESFASADRCTTGAKFNRRFNPRHARQALRAARPGQQAELDFRCPDFR